MADLLIKGMEMPTSCPCELLGTGYDLYCSFALGIPARVKEYYECCQNNKRPSWCPLVSVPPHGRLIEESKVLDIVFGWCPDDDGSVGKVGDLREILDEIEALPTVIEASE